MQLRFNSELQHGKYKIERVLGQGGFGITYLALHTMLEKYVAIKEFFPKEFCGRDTTDNVILGTQNNLELVTRFKNKFIKEAKNISKLHHPGIITIYDIFEENSTAYYVMEFIEGNSLYEIIQQKGPLNEEEAVNYIRKVGDAIDYMHSLSMNHLDIKPANIMIRSSDLSPILIDFGLSKQYDINGEQTSTTPVGISHGYAPFEQYRPNGVTVFTPQTDIYSLGATLFALLLGKTPPHASDLLDGLPEFPSTIQELTRNAIKHAMAINKNNRPASIKIFLSELPDFEPLIVVSDEDNIGKGEDELVKTEEDTIVSNVNVLETIHINSNPSVEINEKESLQFPSKLIVGGIEFVDLGLSIRWANKNVGANLPMDNGKFIDKTIDDDIREVYEMNLNGAKVPTISQWEELRNNCHWDWMEQDGVEGYKITGRTGNSIFLPFSGNEDVSFKTFGRLFTRETFYKRDNSDPINYYFYFSVNGVYKLTIYKGNNKCPVRLIY